MRIMYLTPKPPKPNAPDRTAKLEASLRAYASPGTDIDVHHPEDYPGAAVVESLRSQERLNGLHHTLVTPRLVQKIVWAEEHGYDVVVQSNTFDPGVEEARLVVRIPVIGVLRTSLATAQTMASRIGIVVPLGSHVPLVWRLVEGYGMQGVVKDVRALEIYGEDMAGERDRIVARALELMADQVSRWSVEVLLPLGGLLFPTVVAPEEIQDQLGVPVLNTKSLGIAFAELCVRAGVVHSPVAYPHGRVGSGDFTRSLADLAT